MFDKVIYYATTFAEACLAVFGASWLFEQPAYTVTRDLGADVEIRAYGPAIAAETTAAAETKDKASAAAFRLLFDYITGANAGNQTVAMTAPVEQRASLIAMTAPVRVDASAVDGEARVTMRFFLPAAVAPSPPVPTDPAVRIVTTQAATIAALRFSGHSTEASIAEKQAALLARLNDSGWTPTGAPWFLGYDPPFTLPWFKRNEVAVEVQPTKPAP